MAQFCFANTLLHEECTPPLPMNTLMYLRKDRGLCPSSLTLLYKIFAETLHFVWICKLISTSKRLCSFRLVWLERPFVETVHFVYLLSLSICDDGGTHIHNTRWSIVLILERSSHPHTNSEDQSRKSKPRANPAPLTDSTLTRQDDFRRLLVRSPGGQLC